MIIPAVSEGNYPAELSFSGDVLKFNASVKAAPQVRTAQEYVDKSIERSISIKGRISDGTL